MYTLLKSKLFHLDRRLVATNITADDYDKPTKLLSCDRDPLEYKWPSFALALDFCKDDPCKGVLDQNCDGEFIYTCKSVHPISFKKSNGCTYAKKGIITLHNLLSKHQQ